jgi:phosphoglycerate dehydrogenase-like enzyme
MTRGSTPSLRKKSALLLRPDLAQTLYGEQGLTDIAELTTLTSQLDPQTLDGHLGSLEETEVLFTGWGCPSIDNHLLAAAPRLKAIFFAGGTIRHWITPAVWARGVVVASAYSANAIPVSEYTLATILFSLKRGWHYLARQHRERIFPGPVVAGPGAYGSTVGIVSLGAIGRLVCERLRTFDIKLIAYDPLSTTAEASQLGVDLVGLEELFSNSDVVSVHTPHLPETEGMITGALLEQMRPGATFINTARAQSSVKTSSRKCS